MPIEVLAPAKLNLTLEVLGRRADGYHEIRSVMQTIDLADTVTIDHAGSLSLEIEGEEMLGVPLEGPSNLAFRAAQVMQEVVGRTDLDASIRLRKVIPAGTGLGGGSSDAAAVLRGLNQLWQLGLDSAALRAAAAKVGSDVAFFIEGGTALVSGRGEIVEALPDLEPQPVCLFLSHLAIEDKTRRAYAEISPADFSDGQATATLAASIRRGLPLAEVDLSNAFDRHVVSLAPSLAKAMQLCRAAGLAVHASGSGPGFFSLIPPESLPPMLQHTLSRDWAVRILPARTLTRSQSRLLGEV